MTTNIDMNSKLAKHTTKLVNSISDQVPLEEPDKVLLIMKLDTNEKATAFVDWLKTKTAGNVLNTTPEEIMNQVALIDKP